MKVLVLGPSGSGKTYVSHALQKAGINAFDDDQIEGLSNWYDVHGKKVSPPQTADEAAANQYAFLWSKNTLAAFVNKFPEVFVFGGSGNVFNMLDLFDRVYFLKVETELQKERLLSVTRETPLMDQNDEGIVIWGAWFEEVAGKLKIPFVDASLTPQQIFEIISK